jgi:hypothetical protein
MKHPFTLEEIEDAHRGSGYGDSIGRGRVVRLPDGRTALLLRTHNCVAGVENWDAHVSGDPVDVLRSVQVPTH